MRPAILAACLALIATGCGSSADGAEPLSADEYRAQVSSICRRAQVEGSSARDRGEASSVDELTRWDDETKKEMAGYLTELENLVPPQELQPEATEFMSFARDSVKYWGDYLDASREGTPDEVEAALVAGSSNGKRGNELVAALDIPDCATPDSFTAYGW